MHKNAYNTVPASNIYISNVLISLKFYAYTYELSSYLYLKIKEKKRKINIKAGGSESIFAGARWKQLHPSEIRFFFFEIMCRLRNHHPFSVFILKITFDEAKPCRGRASSFRTTIQSSHFSSTHTIKF